MASGRRCLREARSSTSSAPPSSSRRHTSRCGENLWLYDSRHKAIHRLVDAEAAESYFAHRVSDSSSCAPGVEGEGVAPF